jgi:carbonic anhydrase
MLPAPLRAGYLAFSEGRLRDEQARYATLAEEGQRPRTMLVGCCDSRVSPEVIFGAKPGEIFVARNVANIVPPYRPDGEHHGTSAALEFAVLALEVSHIVVLGHARCGGIRAFAERRTGAPTALSGGDFIGAWITLLGEAERDMPADLAGASVVDYARRLEVVSLGAQLRNLRSFPFITARERAGVLSLHACFFDIATGRLAEFDEEAGDLVELAGGGEPRRPRLLAERC